MEINDLSPTSVRPRSSRFSEPMRAVGTRSPSFTPSPLSLGPLIGSFSFDQWSCHFDIFYIFSPFLLTIHSNLSSYQIPNTFLLLPLCLFFHISIPSFSSSVSTTPLHVGSDTMTSSRMLASFERSVVTATLRRQATEQGNQELQEEGSHDHLEYSYSFKVKWSLNNKMIRIFCARSWTSLLHYSFGLYWRPWCPWCTRSHSPWTCEWHKTPGVVEIGSSVWPTNDSQPLQYNLPILGASLQRGC